MEGNWHVCSVWQGQSLFLSSSQEQPLQAPSCCQVLAPSPLWALPLSRLLIVTRLLP